MSEIESHSNIIQESILRDMSEGVMTIGFNGVIHSMNEAAEKILECPAKDMVGHTLAEKFFGHEENDDFNQLILEAVYDRLHTHKGVVRYFTGNRVRQLRVATSFLHENEEPIGIIVVLSDISELMELRDKVKLMNHIQKLNAQLEVRNQLLYKTFGRYLSDEIVGQLLGTQGGLDIGGKKKELTVMISDLRGFTAMSEAMDAKNLVTMLNHYLEKMTEVIQKHSGTILGLMGDGILAAFGVFSDSCEHASDAVAAALEMQRCMDGINVWNQEQGYPVLEMGIGINTGEVVVGNIGSERHTKFDVIGKNVNLSGRIESYTVGGQVLISQKTKESIQEPLEISMEQTIAPKGVKGTQTVYSVTGIAGAYDLYLAHEKEDLRTLETPMEVQFSRIHQKQVDTAGKAGALLALGKKSAVLRTDEPLKVFENIQIHLEGQLFAKILQKREDGWLIRFTSVPPEAEAILERTMQAGLNH